MLYLYLTMFVRQFRYSRDNLGYFLYSQKQGIAIDSGAPEDIINFAKKNEIEIKYITNTHSHYDHISGNEELIKKTDAKFIDCATIKSDESIIVGNEVIKVFSVPGHTKDSIAFHVDGFLITGDTLFNGTVGNCFTGDLKSFFKSLKCLINYPENTIVYGGHDYVLESMDVARSIENDNIYIDEYIKKYNPDLIQSRLKDELRVNPYIKFNDPKMEMILKDLNLPVENEFERFKSIMDEF